MNASGLGLLDDVLDGAAFAPEQVAELHGFGGLHGGLVAALLLRSMRQHVPQDLVPLEMSMHFLRPLGTVPALSATLLHHGGTTATVTSRAETNGLSATGHGLFGSARGPAPLATLTAPEAPSVVPLERAELFVVPPEFVPITTRLEIRPATTAMPFAGGEDPELCAWVRLRDPVNDPIERLLILADALAPSYAAVITELLAIPTARMTVRFSPAASTHEFDWVLVRATTVEAQADRWLTERVDIWTPAGELLATGSQLRLVRS